MTTNINQETVGDAPDGYEIRWPTFQLWMKFKGSTTATEHFFGRSEGPTERLVGTVTAVTEPVRQSDMYLREKPSTRIVYEAKAHERNFKARFNSTEEAIRWLIAESTRVP